MLPRSKSFPLSATFAVALLMGCADSRVLGPPGAGDEVGAPRANTTGGSQTAKLFIADAFGTELLRYEVSEGGGAVADGTVALGGGARGIAFSPTGEMFVAHTGGEVARFLDPENTPTPNGSLSPANTGAPFASEMQWSDFRYGELFQAQANGTVSRFTFDASGNPTLNGTFGAGSRGLLVNPITGELFSTSLGSSVARFVFDAAGNVSSNGSMPAGGGGSHGMAVTSWGELLVANYYSGTVSRFTFDAAGNAVANGSISGNGMAGPLDVDISPWGEVFVTNHGSNPALVTRWFFSSPDASGTATFNGSFSVPTTIGVLRFFNPSAGGPPGSGPPPPDGGAGFAYVANRDGTVSYIDIATNTVVHSLNAGTPSAGPDFDLSPDGILGYMALQAPETQVSVVDVETSTSLGTIVVGPTPSSSAFSPDGSTAYVTTDAGVAVIDVASGSVTTTIAVGSHPRGVAASRDGARVYVTNFVDHTLSVIDAASNTVISTISLGSVGPNDVAVTPDGARAFVAGYNSGEVLVVDLSTGTVTATTSVAPAIRPLRIGIAPGGARAFVTTKSDYVAVVDVATGSLSTLIDVGGENSDVAFTPDGALAYLSVTENNAVAVIDVAAETIVTTIPSVGGRPTGIAIRQPPNAAPFIAADASAISVDEGDTASNTGTASDPDGDPVTLTASVGTIVDEGDGTWSWTFDTTDGPAEGQTVIIAAEDGSGETSETSFTLTVRNVAPVVTSLTFQTDPVAIDDPPVSASGAFVDPAGAADEAYTCLVDYGDDTGLQVGTVSGTTCQGPSHTYATPGVYPISMQVTDKDGDGASVTSESFLVIYDPQGGFVTGGGWFDSPPGALAADPLLTGKASFGFVSKYKKGANIPTGSTEFQFKTGNLNFRSSSYEWLVVTGNNSAQFKGSGTINGEGDYRFMIWAKDDSPDTFRIRIWSEDASGNESDVYDNGLDQALGGGSIKIHRG